ncbi:MAG: 23S rRNA (uracil(1939)-C(5))-methyltransferase RlmD [Cytophagaceae bacterium]
MSMKKGDILQNIVVEELVAEGKALSRIDQMVLFTSFTAPGDVIKTQITLKKKNFAEGKLIEVEQASPHRVAPECTYFTLCGGCKWQHVDYSTQLHYKQKQVSDSLERIGKINLPPIQPIVGSKNIYYYRNKLDFTFSNKRWLYAHELGDESVDVNGLGFHLPGRFDKVIDVEHCHLQGGPSNDMRNWVRNYALKNQLDFYDVRQHQGLLRNLIIRTTSTGEVMTIFQFQYKSDEMMALMENFKKEFPSTTSIIYFINNKKNETFHDLTPHVFHGLPYITEEMEGLQFRIGPKSFYQTNSEQAYILYSKTRELAGLTGKEVVYDLYTGTGTIANFVAKNAKLVIGIEYVEAAIEDAKINSEINNVHNTTFYAGDMKDILVPSFMDHHPKPDVIITDPPRAGMHEDVVNMLLNIGAQKIVYVSCNVATQARDLQLLDSMYQVTAVQPVDMFPQTAHVENIVLLEKRN